MQIPIISKCFYVKEISVLIWVYNELQQEVRSDFKLACDAESGQDSQHHVFSNVRFASFLFIPEHLLFCIYYL